MLKRYSEFFISLLYIFDMLVISVMWFFSYYARFYIEIIPVYKGIPEFLLYIKLLLPIWVIWGITYKAMGLYDSMRSTSFSSEASKVIKASTLAVIIFITITYLARENMYSRLVFLYFWVLHIAGILTARAIFRRALKLIRKKGYNLRYTIVVGAGELGRNLVQRLNDHPEFGFRIIGYLTRSVEKIGKLIEGVKVIGAYEDLGKILAENHIDQIFIALPFDAHERIEHILKMIGDHPVDVKVVPDLYQFATLKSSIEELDGLPILNLQDSPMYGWNMVIKRLMDIILSSLALIILSPVILMIALLIRLTSKGTVFYTQERMGLDGSIFKIIKFRTMVQDAEDDSGPVWANKDDIRRTRVGKFLRRTSLDEIPQFINVLKGDMSIVGPRPERPVFIEEFRKRVPKYMLRHKVKTGITGWAQVNGWRGNTSIEKRIEHDIYYIENWSINLDIKIMLKTLVNGFINKNAY